MGLGRLARAETLTMRECTREISKAEIGPGAGGGPDVEGLRVETMTTRRLSFE